MNYPANHLSNLTQRCVQEAEEALIAVVKEKYHSLNEEMITHLFACELRQTVAKANDQDRWAEAAMKDVLESVNLHHGYDYVVQQSLSGLVCDVELHSKKREAKTGGDFGLVVSLPVLESSCHGSGEMSISFEDRGLLVQAKRGDLAGRKGTLTVAQAKSLPDHSNYAALVLYSYNDAAQTELDGFQWQSCKDYDLKAMRSWLRTHTFPEPRSSAQVVSGLYKGTLGTADIGIINAVIASPSRSSLLLRLVFSFKGEPPDAAKVIQLSHLLQHEKERVRVYQH
jgi:hypothetical protein